MAELNKRPVVDEVAKKILDYKLNCEANIVSIIYKHPDELVNINLKVNDFDNNVWRIYYAIAYDILKVERKRKLDDITINFYLVKHPNLSKAYEEYGGWEKIVSNFEYVDVANLDSYVKELYKWKALLRMNEEGYPIKDRLSKFTDMDYEDIYTLYECMLNDIFISLDNDYKKYDICDGIYELIDNLDEGFATGLSYHNLDILNGLTGGQALGNITLVGGVSNVGKSSFARTSTLPTVIKENEKVVIILNEEGLQKYQRELLVWVANNILNYDLQKHVVRDGNYTDEIKSILRDAAKWLEEQTSNHTITIIPLQHYSTKQAIKIIRKYANMGVKYFILDTFKMDSGNISEVSWLQMQQSMVDIYDVIKPEALNVHILITFQLSKGSIKQRYYTQDNIGMAKNIVDTASTCIMIRDVLPDEFKCRKNAIKVHKANEVNKNGEPIEVKLDTKNRYQILFITKNREGSANQKQIVVEHDLSRNILKEVGICEIAVDF